MTDFFYRDFEETYRGSRELIKRRLKAYLPFIQPLFEQNPAAPALDLGCGRGEWLEVLAIAGFAPTGIDLDEGMLSACHDLGLSACKGEAVAHLSTLPDNSQAIISAFHVVEHISFEQLRSLVSEALRVLKPGGLLIMETPNPENIIVATRNFYLDPTHQRPIPIELLYFLPKYYGFKRIKTMRLQESEELAHCETLTLQDVFQGVSPDYAIIAQKEADSTVMAVTDMAFGQEYGLTLETLSERYDSTIQLKIQQAMIKAEQAEIKAKEAEIKAQQAEIKAQQAEIKAQQAEEKLIQLLNPPPLFVKMKFFAKNILLSRYGVRISIIASKCIKKNIFLRNKLVIFINKNSKYSDKISKYMSFCYGLQKPLESEEVVTTIASLEMMNDVNFAIKKNIEKSSIIFLVQK